MSKYFDRIQKYYNKGYYTLEQVKDFCNSGAITEEEYKKITGLDFK